MGAESGGNMAERDLAVAILAAGKGTRMRSQLPKVLHKLGSLSLIERLLRTVLTLKPQRCLVIVGYGQEQVRRALQEYPVEFVEQAQQLGTGHAVQQLLPVLEDFQGDLLVVNGDVPLLRAETLQALLERHRQVQPDVTLLSAQVADPYGYGRVFCDAQQRILELVEERDCTPAEAAPPRRPEPAPAAEQPEWEQEYVKAEAPPSEPAPDSAPAAPSSPLDRDPWEENTGEPT